MLTKLLNAVDRSIGFLAVSIGWVSLLVLIGLRVYEVVARQYIVVNAGMLRRNEALAFALLVVLSLGYAYSKNAHVRVDILRARLSPRAQAWLEIAGGILVILPVTGAVIGLFAPFLIEAAEEGRRWWFGAVLPFGFGLLGLAGLVVIARNILFLTGRAERPAPADPES